MTTLLGLVDVVLRWMHVIAAIMWVGNSLLFNWLDRNLNDALIPRDRSMGEAWLLHSGAFYHVEKTLALGDVSTRAVHWFKWQSYTTWLTGAALLIAVYYATGGALLVNPASGISERTAIAVGVGALLGGWMIYGLLWRSPLKELPRFTALLCFVLVLALGAALDRVFTGRAAFLHIGALLGTIMAGNVRFHIMTAQRAFVASIDSGVPGDERLAKVAKLRSIHNNYITFPVIALMLSSHFPSLYSAPHSWAVLGVLLLGGAGFRHILNIRWTFNNWKPALAAHMVVTMAALYLLTMPRSPSAQGGGQDTGNPITATGPIEPARAYAVIQKRCAVCHSTAPANRTFGTPPAGVAFDSPAQMRALVARIENRAVVTKTMPPGNLTWITDEERAVLGRWARQVQR